MTEHFETFGDPLTDAFLTVGVVVAVMLVFVGTARARWGPKWDRWLTKFPKAGPLAAAALSLPPGCSGAIVTVTLYGERRVTFGTVVAALTATMGDSAWLLLAADPVLALELKALFFVVGALVGYIADAVRMEPRAREFAMTATMPRQEMAQTVTTARPSASSSQLTPMPVQPKTVDTGTTSEVPPSIPVSGPAINRWMSIEPCCVDPSLLPSSPSPRSGRGILPAFWSLIAIGFVMQLPVEFNIVDEVDFPGLFGFNLYMAAGIVGFVVAAACAADGRRHQKRCQCNQGSAQAAVLRHTAYRAASMITLVGAVTLFIAIVTAVTGFEPTSLPFYGAAGVALAAALGLVPSCGLEVVVAGVFIVGGMPLPALLAYLMSHDGAGLLPLFAVHKRSAIFAALLTTLAALVVGFAALALS